MSSIFPGSHSRWPRGLLEQGYELGRPSLITLSLTARNRRLAGAAIGGEAVAVSEGTIET